MITTINNMKKISKTDNTKVMAGDITTLISVLTNLMIRVPKSHNGKPKQSLMINGILSIKLCLLTYWVCISTILSRSSSTFLNKSSELAISIPIEAKVILILNNNFFFPIPHPHLLLMLGNNNYLYMCTCNNADHKNKFMHWFKCSVNLVSFSNK